MLLLHERIEKMQGEKTIYEKIFDITNENLKLSGNEMPFTKEAFLYSTESQLGYVNIFDLLLYNKRTFLQCLYIALFYRTPEKMARENWGKLDHLNDFEFQQKAIQSLMASEEYIRNGVIIYNNPYTEPKIQIGRESIEAVQMNPYIKKLYNYYKKMPILIKKVIRRVVGA